MQVLPLNQRPKGLRFPVGGRFEMHRAQQECSCLEKQPYTSSPKEILSLFASPCLHKHRWVLWCDARADAREKGLQPPSEPSALPCIPLKRKRAKKIGIPKGPASASSPAQHRSRMGSSCQWLLFPAAVVHAERDSFPAGISISPCPLRGRAPAPLSIWRFSAIPRKAARRSSRDEGRRQEQPRSRDLLWPQRSAAVQGCIREVPKVPAPSQLPNACFRKDYHRIIE